MTILHLPTVTMHAAGLLGLLFVLLSGMVTANRFTGKVNLGSGESLDSPDAAQLFVAVRSQANFAEYVPLALLLIGLIELATGPTLFIKILAFCLVLARVMHPVGLRMSAPNPFRAGGFALTAGVLLVASVKVILVALA